MGVLADTVAGTLVDRSASSRRHKIRAGGQTADSNTFLVSPGFFNLGGFGSFTLTGLGSPTGTIDVYNPAVTIAAGTAIRPTALSQFIDPNVAFTGELVLTQTLLPEAATAYAGEPVVLQKRPELTISLRAERLSSEGTLSVGEGSSIITDPKANVSISGNTAAVLGTIIAPAGSISVAGGGNSSSLFLSHTGDPLATVDLGPQSHLSTAGVTLLTPNSLGFRTGSVLPGGSINLSGNIVAEAGSVLDVSGATDSLDVVPGFAGVPVSTDPTALLYIRTRIDSNGGSITFGGQPQQEFFSGMQR